MLASLAGHFPLAYSGDEGPDIVPVAVAENPQPDVLPSIRVVRGSGASAPHGLNLLSECSRFHLRPPGAMKGVSISSMPGRLRGGQVECVTAIKPTHKR